MRLLKHGDLIGQWHVGMFGNIKTGCLVMSFFELITIIFHTPANHFSYAVQKK